MSISIEHQLIVPKKIRYYTLGDPDESENLLIVLHGYGQLAKYFIQKFSDFSNQCCVLAPEGLHRFYLNGTSGRVGASWMTKEARESDISDNQVYLDLLLSEFTQKHSFKKTILLGFSQGGATAARFFNQTKFKIDHLIIWASVFPPDITISLTPERYLKKKNYFVLGNSDEYFDDQSSEAVINEFASMQFETICFQGTHDIENETLKDILKQIE